MIVIGGSAGSIEIALPMLEALPTAFSTPVLIVIHRGNTDSDLAKLFQSRTHLLVKEAEDKEVILERHIYVAPPDYHLLVEKDGTLSLDASEKIHWSRPSIDATFETAADAFKERLTAVLLSGANADGASGVATVQKCGGHVMIQHPDSALINVMPMAAKRLVRGALLLRDEELIEKFINL